MEQHSWTDEEHEELVKLKEQGLSYQQIADRLSFQYDRRFTHNSVRNRLRRTKDKHKQEKLETAAGMPGYKETHEILPDGSHKSDKLLWMSDEEKKSVDYMLHAHGFDKDQWQLISVKNNIWNTNDKKNGVQTLYASKITVKPKEDAVNWNEIIKKMEIIQPLHIEPEHIRDIDYLSLPLFDMHFGVSRYEHYIPTQKRIAGLLEKGYKGVLFILGQDMLHNDNMKGQTANGTPIDKVDMDKAWEDALKFYIPLINQALRTCQHVKIIYSKGNHDESMSWAFVKGLKFKFPSADIDTSFVERKVHMLGLNFIGLNHGDKKKEANLNENFSTEFPMEWSRAKTREIFTGHLHHERVLDKGGAVIRRMPTGNEIDDYHNDHGYTTAHKRFQIFEYSEDAVKRIHYV